MLDGDTVKAVLTPLSGKVLSYVPSRTDVGLISDGISVSSGSVGIGLTLVPGAQGAQIPRVISGIRGRSGALFDTMERKRTVDRRRHIGE